MGNICSCLERDYSATDLRQAKKKPLDPNLEDNYTVEATVPILGPKTQPPPQ